MYRYRQICIYSKLLRKTGTAKGLTRVEHFQQLQKWNKFLQGRMNVKKIISANFFGDI